MPPETTSSAREAQVRPMDVRYINPFVASVSDVFGRTLSAWVKRDNPRIQRQAVPDETLAALIGLSGPIRGVVTLVVPMRTALAIVRRMLGCEVSATSPDLPDGLAELVNIVAGGAKARLAESEVEPVNLGLPSVVKGDRFSMCYPSNTNWLEIPFESQLGLFSLRVTIETTR
jgi:chemotaxis protein CheX